MTVARLKRLEARQPPRKVVAKSIRPGPGDMGSFRAVAAGRASWIPLPGPELSPEAQEWLAIALRDSDRMHERLRAEREAA